MTILANRVGLITAAAFVMLATIFGAVTPAVADAQDVPPVATSVTAFVGVAGAPSQPFIKAGYLLSNYGDFLRAYPSAPQQMVDSVAGFFTTGGNGMSIYPSASSSAEDLIAAIETTSVPVNGQQPANLLVVPALSQLDGPDYYNVATEMDVKASALPAVALLDLPQKVVTNAMATGETVEPLAVSNMLSKTLPTPAVAALYTSPLIDPNFGHVVPAAGPVAGDFAANDVSWGVWNSPSGAALTMAGYVAQWLPTYSELGTMAGTGLNSFHQLATSSGDLLWGSRTLDLWDPLSRYISEVRLKQYVASSVARGLQWTVFNPSGPQLWSDINNELTPFLTQLSRQGAFGQGLTGPSFVVTVNKYNNTRADIAAGIVHVDIAYQSLAVPAYVPVNLTARSSTR